MIQRIQSVYLLVNVVLLIVCMCHPVAAFIGADGSVSPFTNLGVDVVGVGRETSCWGMFAILLLSAIVALGTIFLFKNRMLQIRMTIFNITLGRKLFRASLCQLPAFRGYRAQLSGRSRDRQRRGDGTRR